MPFTGSADAPQSLRGLSMRKFCCILRNRASLAELMTCSSGNLTWAGFGSSQVTEGQWDEAKDAISLATRPSILKTSPLFMRSPECYGSPRIFRNSAGVTIAAYSQLAEASSEENVHGEMRRVPDFVPGGTIYYPASMNEPSGSRTYGSFVEIGD